MMVEPTGASSRSMKVRNSGTAPLERITPPPTSTMGRWDWAMNSSSLSMSPWSGSGLFSSRLERRSRVASRPWLACSARGRYWYSPSVAVIFLAMSTSTGPGRPDRAMAKASRITSASSFTSFTRKLHLVMGMVIPVMSTSWKESLPMRFSLTLQVMNTTGEES